MVCALTLKPGIVLYFIIIALADFPHQDKSELVKTIQRNPGITIINMPIKRPAKFCCIRIICYVILPKLIHITRNIVSYKTFATMS